MDLKEIEKRWESYRGKDKRGELRQTCADVFSLIEEVKRLREGEMDGLLKAKKLRDGIEKHKKLNFGREYEYNYTEKGFIKNIDEELYRLLEEK